MDKLELTIKGDVQRLRLRDGDVVVIRCDRQISPEVAEHLREHVIRGLGLDANKNKVLVLNALTLTVQETK
jgi:hypothetical protein